MSYKPHGTPEPLLIAYDPFCVLPPDHLARLVDRLVDSVKPPKEVSPIGQSGYHPAMLAKVMVYGYGTGTFSSRRLAQNCKEHLAYLFLTRGEHPSYRTLCMARTAWESYLLEIWLALNATAIEAGISLKGKLAIDASRFKANASSDLVVDEADYEALQLVFQDLLSQAARIDAKEDEEGQASPSSTGVDASRIVIRTVVRSLGKGLPQGEITPRTQVRMKECIDILEEAKAEGLKHVSLSDPDARMMPLGSRRTVSMGHALEVAVDSGVIVAGGAIHQACDTGRLVPLVQEARLNDPIPITEVSADSGYFEPEEVVQLLDEGLEVIVPDATTAHKMRRKDFSKEEKISFEPVPGRDAYVCPEGNVLILNARDGKRKQYRASRECTGCVLAEKCLKKKEAKRRHLWVRAEAERVLAYLALFDSPEMLKLYYARGPSVETVFAFLRNILGFSRWSVRGKKKIAAEAELLKCAYQVRKIHIQSLKTA